MDQVQDRVGVEAWNVARFCKKLFGRRKVQASPEASISFSTGRWALANEKASLPAPQTESFTTCRTPAFFAWRTALISHSACPAYPVARRNRRSAPARAGRRVSGFK